jgi:hypothetical protein
MEAVLQRASTLVFRKFDMNRRMKYSYGAGVLFQVDVAWRSYERPFFFFFLHNAYLP